jgi:glyoxylase-like metal-dependent hydrolase (beta-lactamase superfamily II)
VITVGEGDSVDGFSVAYTPGHARHHVCYLHEASGDAFTGDLAGLTIPPSGFVLAPTPPPEVDLDAWNGSLDRLLAWRPERACVTHCGAFAGVPERVGAVRENLSWLAELARRGGRGRFVADLLEALRAACDEESVVERFVQAAPPDQLHAGLARYWATRA